MKRKLPIFLLCAMLLTSFAGCSSGSEDTDSAPSGGDTAISAEKADAASSAEGAENAPAEENTPADSTPDAGNAGDAAPDDANAIPDPLAAPANEDGAVSSPEGNTSAEAGNNTPTAGGNTASDAVIAVPATGEELLHITVDTVEVSAADLADMNYTVQVYVNIDKNPGITYSEWGAAVDDRCTFGANTSRLDYGTVYSINDEKHLLWTAWSSGAQITTDEGALLRIIVMVPQNAAAGDFYAVDYLDVSAADLPHKWSDGTNDWVAGGNVGYTNGGIRITE